MRITWEDKTPDLDPCWVSTVELRHQDGDWYTFTTHRWVGIAVDFAQTFSRAVIDAWMYGDKADVLRATTRVHREAGRHAAAHKAD